MTFLAEVNSDLLDDFSKLPFTSICKKMVIIDQYREVLYPRNIGLLFFNDMPDRFMPYCQIDVVQFTGNNRGSDELTEKIFKGPIWQQVRDVLRFIQNVVIQEQVIKLSHQAESIRCFNYPFSALEEAIVNAVYHRDYRNYSPIEISIFSDHIDILSFPGPDRSIRLSDLRHGEIIVFDTDEGRSYFVVTFKIHSSFVSDHGADHGADYDILLNDIEIRILNTLQTHGALSKLNLLNIIGYAALTKTIKTAFINLLKLSFIQYTIPDKPKSKNQQYAITDLGKKYLNYILHKEFIQ